METIVLGHKLSVCAYRLIAATVVCLAASITALIPAQAATSRHTSVQSPRLYVFDCGTIHIPDTSLFSLKREEVAESDMSVPCFLVVHPRGTLIWDVGVIPDSEWTPNGSTIAYPLLLADGRTRNIDVRKRLKDQLGAVGYSEGDITYIALSHYHYDHTANANDFARSTWLVRQNEHDAMFAEPAAGRTRLVTYAALKYAKTIIIKTDDYDVFGDGTVMIRAAPGHTPGHQMLLLKLAHSGRILLSGDLYHYPEERTLDRVPTFEFSPDQTRASRKVIEAFLKVSGTQLWIQHDIRAMNLLKHSPDYYD